MAENIKELTMMEGPHHSVTRPIFFNRPVISFRMNATIPYDVANTRHMSVEQYPPQHALVK